jgi:hypothetical protein
MKQLSVNESLYALLIAYYQSNPSGLCRFCRDLAKQALYIKKVYG